MSLNFPLLLVIAVFVCGLLALLDLLFLAPRRRAAIASYQGSVSQPEPVVVEKLNKEPLLVEYGKSFFPVLFIVLVLRSFLVEPFQIPSGSMKPTLDVGDFILVNKFSYGIRLPVIDKKIIEVGDPQRGDVMVFRYPSDPNVNYIKRVVGVPATRCVTPPTSVCSSMASRLPSNWSAPSRARWAARNSTRKTRRRRAPDPQGNEPLPRDAGPYLDRAGRALLHDGRQPRQLQRQSLLG